MHEMNLYINKQVLIFFVEQVIVYGKARGNMFAGKDIYVMKRAGFDM